MSLLDTYSEHVQELECENCKSKANLYKIEFASGEEFWCFECLEKTDDEDL